MNLDHLSTSGSENIASTDPYNHHHHLSSIYCSSSTPYTDLFSPFVSDFVTSHEPVNNPSVPTDYLLLQNSLDYVASYHPSAPVHPHQLPTSSNRAESSPSRSYDNRAGFSSAVDYYNTSGSLANHPSSLSPYERTSTASSSSSPRSTGYLNTTVKQESAMPASFTHDRHNSSYGSIRGHPNSAPGVDNYDMSLYHPSISNNYASYSSPGLLQTSYPVGPYGVSQSDQMRFYNQPLKHDYGMESHFKFVGNQRSSPLADISPSQLCAVCQDSAQCQHYGVRTCEGCKGFFKRTVQKNAKYVCLADKNCPVDKRRRNRCQYCRYQTCLAVGMDKEVVRSDALKGRRGRLPSKPKNPSIRQPNSFQTQFCRFYNDSIPNPTNLDFSKLNYRTVTSKEHLAEEKLLVYDVLVRSSEVIKQWVDKFASFYSISTADRDHLYSNCLFEQLVFRTATRVDNDRLVLCSGVVLHRVQINFLFGDVTQQIYDYASTLKLQRIDSILAASLASLLLLDSSNTEYTHQRAPLSTTVTELYQKITDSLKEYLKQQQEESSVYAQLMDRLNDARSIAHNLRKRLLLYRHTAGLTHVTNTLLDLVLECKPISADSHSVTEDCPPAMPFMQYGL